MPWGSSILLLEGKSVKKLVKAVNAAMGNDSNASSLLEEEVDEEEEGDDEQDGDEEGDEEGKPVKKLVQVIQAATGNGSNASAMLDD